MAKNQTSIFGTKEDRVNCPFYFKTGACGHGDRCSRLHTRPSNSPTILLSNMYQRPDMITQDPRHTQQHFDDFCEDIFEKLSKHVEIESINVCDNLADHMVGNVYVQFGKEEHAANVLKNLTGRFYAGRPIIVDFSPVADFREATYRQYEENTCHRGGYCNFMHLKRISRELRSIGAREGSAERRDKIGHVYIQFRKEEQSDSGNKGENTDWIVDSGVSHHMTRFLELMTNVRDIEAYPVGFPNGDTMMGTKEGTVNLGRGLTLTNVLFVPKLKQLTFCRQASYY
ncbi:hypothetical protein MKX01_011496 [Papaver californicum]|nr:hypothetical protein MKX01_011496 [Papaver californicum]